MTDAMPEARQVGDVALPADRPAPRRLRVRSGSGSGASPMCACPGAATMLGMITVTSLTKTYGRNLTAVNDVSFTAATGRVTGFLGPNGAGKSTTLRIVVGLTPATSGHGPHRRTSVHRPPQPGHRGRGPPRCLRPARRPHRPRDPHHRPADHGPAPHPGRGDARPGQPHRRGGGPTGAQLLTRDATAPRDRCRAPRRPPRAHPRRTGERPRPGRHPVDARPAAGLRRSRWHGPPLLAPAPRDRGHRRRPRRHRQRPDRGSGHQGRAAGVRRHRRPSRRRRRPGGRDGAPRAHRHGALRRQSPHRRQPRAGGRGRARCGRGAHRAPRRRRRRARGDVPRATADTQREGAAA